MNDSTPVQPGTAAATTTQRRFTPGLVERFWSVLLPRWLDPYAPQVADAFADGAWTATVRGLAALVPVAALLLGLRTQQFWPDVDFVFTQSLSFMAFAAAIAILSGPAGVMFLLGFAAQDLLEPYRVLGRHDALENFVRQRGGQLVTYLLLGLLTVVVPVLARRMGVQTWMRLRRSKNRVSLLVVCYAGAAALLVYLWAHAMVLLIGTPYNWWPTGVEESAVAPVQIRWPWLVAVAIIAVLVRVFLEGLARRSPRAASVTALKEERARSGARLQQSRPAAVVRIILETAVLTLILSGLYVRGWRDAFVVAPVALILGAWRSGLLRTPAPWWAVVERIPALARLLVAVASGYLLAYQMWGGRTPRSSFPFLAGALLTLVLAHLLFPPSPALTTGAPERREVT